MKLIRSLVLFGCLFFASHLNAARYGSDAAVSLLSANTNPLPITGAPNDIRAFCYADNKFSFLDSSTTCSFYSAFPVASPIALKGGSLWLNTDLYLNNPGTFTDLGIIQGQGHVVSFSPNQYTLASQTNPTGQRNFLTKAQVTLTRTVNSLAWSYDNNYLAVVITSGAGNELFIYSFSGSALTLVASANLAANGNCVRWSPRTTTDGLHVLAVAVGAVANNLLTYTFNASTNTLSIPTSTTVNTSAMNSLSWQGRGNYVAIASTNYIAAYAVTYGVGSVTVGTKYTPAVQPTITVANNALAWPPVGSPDQFMLGTGAGTIYVYSIPGAGTTLTANISGSSISASAINGLDWALTGTNIAVALAATSNNVGVYSYTAGAGSISSVTTITAAPANVNTVSWKYDASQLDVGTVAIVGANEFYSFNFNGATLKQAYSVNVAAGVNFIRTQRTAPGTYVARADNTSFVVSVLDETTAPFIVNNTEIVLNGDLTLGAPLSFTGSCTVNGQGNTLTITGNGGIVIPRGASVRIQNTLVGIKTPTALSLQAPTSKLILEESIVELKSDLTLANGSLQTYGDVTITGPQTFTLSTIQTSTIHTDSRLILDNLVKLSLGRTQLSGSNPLEFEDSSSRLNLNDASLVVTGSGLTLKKGIINIYGDSNFNINPSYASAITNPGLTLGDGTAANDVTVKFHGNGATLNITSGTPQGSFIVNAKSQDTFQFFGQPELSLDITSSMYIPNRMKFVDGWLNVAGSNQLYIAPSAYIEAENLRYTNPLFNEDFLLTGTLNPPAANSITLDAGDNIVLNGHNFAQKLNVQGTNNALYGSGNIDGPLTLKDANTTLSIDLVTNFGTNNVTLNGGTIYANNAISFAHSYVMDGNGKIVLDGNILGLGNQTSTWAGTLYFDGDQALLEFNSDVDLTGKWTFSGDCIIDGKGNEIDLLNTGTILIERGSTLTLKNMTVENLSRSNDLACLDNGGKLILDNCTIQLSSGYKWPKGTIEFVNDNKFISSGTLDSVYTFSYESPETSEFYERASLQIYDGVNFELGKKTATGGQPFEFADDTGVVDLWGGSLTITASGMALTKGTVRSFRSSTIDVRGNTTSTGLTFGDGTVANDAKLQVGVGGGNTLTVKNGKILYNNASSANRIVFDNSRATLNLANGATVTALTDLVLQNGTIRMPTDVSLIQAPNKLLSQTNITHDHITHSHNVNLSTIYPYTVQPNSSFTTITGISTTALTYVPGSSVLAGTGILNANVTLQNSATTVNASLTPFLEGSVILNGGTFVLDQPFGFIGANNFVGQGTVNIGNQKLTFGQVDSALTTSLSIISTAGQLELNSALDMFSSVTFSGGICSINGRANVVDFAHGGIVTIAPNTTLILNNVILHGLGKKRNNLIFMDSTSQLKLFNSFIGLDNSITTTNGGVYVAGNSVVALKDHNWTFDLKSSLTVDGVVLWKESLGDSSCGKILFGPGDQSKYLTLLNTGTIKQTANEDLIFTSTNDIDTLLKQTSNSVNYYAPIVVANSNAINHYAPIINADDTLLKQTSNSVNYYAPVAGNINLSNTSLQLAGDKTLTSNAYLTSGGTINGNGYTLKLTSSFVIPENNIIKISGNIVIDGQGNNFVVGQNAQFIVDPTVSVTLRNLNWFNSNTEPHLQMRADTSSLTLDMVNTNFDRNFSFTQGRLFIENEVMVTGTNKFSYSSLQPMYIEPFSTLRFDVGSTFSYSPINRNLVRLVDRTSQLYLNNCTVDTPNGMQLTRGTIIFDNRVVMNGDLELGDGISSVNNVAVDVLSAADIVRNGTIYYNPAA